MRTLRLRRLVLRAVIVLSAVACSRGRPPADTATPVAPTTDEVSPAGDAGAAGPAAEVAATAVVDVPVEAPAPVAAPASIPGLVARWSVQSLWGGERIEIGAGGEMLYVILAGAGSPGSQDREYRGTATPEELERLRSTLAENGVCDLRSERETGIPDEGHPTLDVAFPDLQCTVSMWDGEWLERPAPRACQEAVHALARRLVPPQNPS
jgi:hypothetical protein